jgi:hypothetical protein
MPSPITFPSMVYQPAWALYDKNTIISLIKNILEQILRGTSTVVNQVCFCQKEMFEFIVYYILIRIAVAVVRFNISKKGFNG